MKTATRKVRSPLKWHGGKSYLARRIIAGFPDHATYCEPCFGGGSVLLNKPPSAREVVGDLDPRLVHFWATLRDHGRDLCRFLGEIDYRRESFDEAVGGLDDDDPVSRAAAYVVRNRMSRGGMGKDFAWSDRLRGGQPGELNSWDTIRAAMPAISERLRDVEINCCDAVQLIGSNDGPAALIYCDPPYLHATRTHRKAYAHEMGDAGHRRLLEALMGCRGRVVLSGYAHPLYDEALAGWGRSEIPMPNHSGQGKTKQRRVEVVWDNGPFRDVGRSDPLPGHRPLPGQLSLFAEA